MDLQMPTINHKWPGYKITVITSHHGSTWNSERDVFCRPHNQYAASILTPKNMLLIDVSTNLSSINLGSISILKGNNYASDGDMINLHS